MLDATGGCLCGAVRYRLAGEPAMVAVCHCRTCQRNTGSAFSTNVAFPANAAFSTTSAMPREAVSVEGDDLATYETRAGSDSPPFFRSFCARCGSPVCARGDAYPGIVFVKAGTLDEPTLVAPTAHIWCSEQLPWVQAGDDAPRFSAGPGG